MRILIISNSEWDSSNSFGSTFDNFFEGIKDVEIANIYCREGTPKTTICKRFLKLSDKELVKGLLTRKYDPCKPVQPSTTQEPDATKGNSSLKAFLKQKRWATIFVVREILWSLSNYKKQNFYNFVEEFSPDLIFLPTYSYAYINKMALHLQKKYNLPMVSYMSDDEYSLRRLRISPVYWLLRLYQNKWVKRGLKASKIVYVISELQKSDCKKELDLDCKILTKSADFSVAPLLKEQYNTPLKLVYTGNLGNNRYKTLGLIAQALKELNTPTTRAILDIYTATPITKKMDELLNLEGSCSIKGQISAEEVTKVQEQADILVHVEGFDLKNRLEVRQSFSTKIIDYFKTARPILAVGPKDVASIQHLINNNCAIYASNKKELVLKLKYFIDNKDELTQVVQNAYACGKRYHNKKTTQDSFIKDLKSLFD